MKTNNKQSKHTTMQNYLQLLEKKYDIYKN